MIRERAAGKEREKYGVRRGKGVGNDEQRSSEDVWQARRWKVKGAFQRDWEFLEKEAKEAREGADVEMEKEVR